VHLLSGYRQLAGTRHGQTVFNNWFAAQANNRMTSLDMSNQTGTVSVDGAGNVAWVSGDKFRPSMLAAGSYINLGGNRLPDHGRHHACHLGDRLPARGSHVQLPDRELRRAHSQGGRYHGQSHCGWSGVHGRRILKWASHPYPAWWISAL